MDRGMPAKTRVGLGAVTPRGVLLSYQAVAEQGSGPGQDQCFLVLHRPHRASGLQTRILGTKREELLVPAHAAPK